MFWNDRNKNLNEELQAHIEHEIDHLKAAGMEHSEAERVARRDFGSMARTKEDVRSEWLGGSIESFVNDLRYGLRLWWRAKSSAAMAIVSLSLGIGVSCSIFAFVHATILQPLPFDQPQQLVEAYQAGLNLPAGYKIGASALELQDWKEQSRAFSDFAQWDWSRHHLMRDGRPLYLSGLKVTPNFFHLLGVQAARGRTLGTGDFVPGHKGIVLSHKLWVSRFGGDPAIVGKAILLDGDLYHVTGVMPQGFQYPPYDRDVPGLTGEYWEPLLAAQSDGRDSRDATPIGRLRPGATLAQGRDDLEAIVSRLGAQHPETSKGLTVAVEGLEDKVNGNLRPILPILGAMILLIMLAASANVANLLLARSAMRGREMATRISLGAEVRRIYAQLVAENLIFCLVSAFVGLLAAHWTATALIPLFPRKIPHIEEVGIDLTVIGAALALAVFAALFISTWPLLALSRHDVAEGLRQGPRQTGGGRGVFRITQWLGVVQTALSLTLVAVAGLMAHSLWAALHVDFGFSADHVLTVRMNPRERTHSGWQGLKRFYTQVLQETEQQPGVRSAALAMSLPLSGRSYKHEISTLTGVRALAEGNVVTPNYFETMGVTLQQGRRFQDLDKEGAAPVVIVNRALAQQLLGNSNAAGMTLRIDGKNWTVAGVVADEKHFTVEQPAEPKYYIPFAQANDPASRFLTRILTFLVIRTDGDAGMMSEPVRNVIWKVDPELPLEEVSTMTRIVDNSLAERRLIAYLSGAIGIAALLTALIGLYGVMDFCVGRAIQEIGVRMAMGATPGHVFRVFLWRGMRMAGVGVSIGLACTIACSGLIGHMLFQVKPLDYVSTGGAAAAVLLTAAISCGVPALRASRILPAESLRQN